MARALPGLPALSAAFAAGTVSYAKVRAVSRVATAANEALLVDYARAATAAQLQAVVRGFRQVTAADDGDDQVDPAMV